ncbi:hypothetical protein CSB07_01760 [Candidatus Gracilibacteria bacterium]|nr:MAG: hypothetical protein CSB07_01760 [Candidatus Gracilibacteria bacterium]
MITAKKDFFDRVAQSFVLFKSNFLGLFLPFFLYNLLYFVLGYFVFLKMGGILISEVGNYKTGIDFFSALNNTKTIIFISIGIVFFLLYLILYIPLYISLVKSIKDSFESKKVKVKDNLLFGFRRILNSFATYYYIFIYVVGIPVLFFVIGGVLFNLTFYLELDRLIREISIWIIFFSLILFFFFLIYRGVKSKFGLIFAIENDAFNKQNFLESINLTNGNWLRILGNIFLFGIIVGSIKLFLSFTISIIGYFNSTKVIPNFISSEDIISMINNGGNINQLIKIEDIKNIFEYFFQFELSSFIKSILNVGLNTVSVIFVTIFLYILMKRIELEKNVTNKKTTVDKENIERLELINGEKRIEL